MSASATLADSRDSLTGWTLGNTAIGTDATLRYTIADAEGGLLADATQWPDNTADKWYYLAVLEATNTHDHTLRTSGELTENWTQILPDPTWD